MLTPWVADPAARRRLRWFSAVTDCDLARLGTDADEVTVRDTAVAQPLLVAAGLVGAAALVVASRDVAGAEAVPGTEDERVPGAALGAGMVAGHSVGELVAAALAGSLTFEQALVLVRERGRAMAAAAAATAGGMTAVLGGDPDQVLQALARHGLTAANVNGAGQVVAAGDPESLAALAADPPPRARLRSLAVAGAFHTDQMAPATDRLREVASGLTPTTARVPVVSNADGVGVTGGDDLLRRIVGQVSRGVRWDACQQTFADAGVTGLLELPPAGTLTGLARRVLPGVETFALRTPADLPAAAEFVARHRAAHPAERDGEDPADRAPGRPGPSHPGGVASSPGAPVLQEASR